MYYEILGNGIAKMTGGLSNSISWKQFRLDALIDFKVGGDIYSGSEVNLTAWGLHKQTLAYREGGMPIEGVIQTGTDTDGNPIYSPLSMTLNQEADSKLLGKPRLPCFGKLRIRCFICQAETGFSRIQSAWETLG